MIVTLTANPSVDRTVQLAGALERGQVLRAVGVAAEPGGKGVNVARAVTAAGRVAVAVLPGQYDDPLVQALRDLGVTHRAVPVSGPVRVNLTVAEPDGTTTKINEPGLPLEGSVLAALQEALVREAAGARWAVLSGSLPPGVPADWYADLVVSLRGHGCSVVVDTSGSPLTALLGRGAEAAPDLLKPNSEELAEATGGDPHTLEGDIPAAVAASRLLISRGVGAVLATLGSRGALLVTAGEAWLATPPAVVPRSTVGAGDASLAGYLLADLAGAAPPERLRAAVAYGAAAVSLPGSAMPRPDQTDPLAVTVESVCATSTVTPPTRHSFGPGSPRGHPMTQLITADLVALDDDLGATPEQVIRALAQRVADTGRASSADGLVADALAREAQSATGLPGGIAIPHCRSEHVTQASLAFARLAPKVPFGAADGPADLVFLIAAPAGGDQDHLKLLTKLARALVRPQFTADLRSAATDDDIVRLVEGVVSPAPAAAGAPSAATAAGATAAAPAAGASQTSGAAGGGAATAVVDAPQGGQAPVGATRTIVAVTACPTGIAHTYMAADSLTAAAERAGVVLHVETQGSAGSTPLSAETIASADAVILATDVGVRSRERFAGKPVVASGVKRAINEPDVMVAEALAAAANPNAARVQGSVSTADAGPTEGSSNVHWGIQLRQWLLTGVSYMIPFVAAGGLLIALGFLLGGYDITGPAQDIVADNSLVNLPPGGLSEYLGAVLFTLGSLAFSFLVPALAGYIAFAIADRPGIAPGFTVGLVAVTVNAGFIGGLIGGLLAGFAALWIGRLAVPQWARGLMPVVIIPLGATLLAGGLMVMVLGRPLAAVSSGLEDWLNGLTGGSALLLGAILGLMMAFDMGGPLNKAAYVFATAGLAGATAANDAPFTVMAAVMAAGMVPPLALALATVVRPGSFSQVERENGKAAWLLGASFITEGAIPFAAADPLRVIPPIMLGAATTGAIVMVSDVTLRAPHGGIFVFFAMDNVLMFVVALVVGTVVGAAAVVVAKQIGRRPEPVTV